MLAFFRWRLTPATEDFAEFFPRIVSRDDGVEFAIGTDG